MALHRKVVLLLLMVLAVISFAGGKKAPSCREALRSHKNKPPANGRVSVGKSILKYSCNNGYKLIGNARRSCKKGKVIGRSPQCVRNVTCEKPILRNGIVRGVDFTVGERIKYKCKHGYRMISGDESSKCMRNGKWSNKKPTCEKILCSPAYISLLPADGNVTTTDRTNSLGAKVYFECKDNYELVGVDTLTCTNSGRWDRRRPYCRAIKCPHPGQLPNGMVAGTNDLKIGSKITFTCLSGYRLLGSRVRTCQENRRWDGSLTVCDSGNFHCPTLGKPIKGEKHGDQYNQGDVVKFSCEDGYVLRGSSVRVCLQNGTWNGTEAYCIDEQQARYKDENETARLLRENLLDTVMQYTCTDDNSTCNVTLPSDVDARARAININAKTKMDLVFVLDGSSSIRKRDFELGLKFAKRLVEMIGANRRPGLPEVHFAAVTYGSEAQLEFNLGDADVDSTKKAIRRIEDIQRVMGGTNSEAALQKVIDVIVPEAGIESKRFLVFITDGRSNIGGPPEKIAKTLRRKHKFEIFGIGVGDKINKRQLAAVASKPYEEHVIEVENYKTLEKGLNKAAEIKIDYSACGVRDNSHRGRMVGGTDSKHGSWPWMARIYKIKIIGGGRENEELLVCGGSLIRRRWVLTAAHCFVTKKGDYTHQPNKFNIMLGDHDTQSKEPSEQRMKAQKIFYHKDYNRGTFENDIALIKLKTKAKLGKSVRTLCLPNEDIAFPGKDGYVAGWGVTVAIPPDERDKQKYLDKYSRFLQESAFTIQEDSLCSNKTKHVVNPNVTFCAGDGEGGNDTCWGDSGGPFTRDVLINEEKREYQWMAAGLVSWGEGCAQKGKYGYYTRVWPFVDWIENTIKANTEPGDDEDDEE